MLNNNEKKIYNCLLTVNTLYISNIILVSPRYKINQFKIN